MSGQFVKKKKIILKMILERFVLNTPNFVFEKLYSSKTSKNWNSAVFPQFIFSSNELFSHGKPCREKQLDESSL